MDEPTTRYDTGEAKPTLSERRLPETPPPKTEQQSTEQRSSDKNTDGGAAPDSKKPNFFRAHPWLVAIAAVVLIVGIVAGVLWWLQARHYETTDDAFIDARQFPISPKIAGYITDVSVTDNQLVPTGAMIAQIDPRDYQTALDEATARQQAAQGQLPSIDDQIAQQQAQIAQAQQQADESKAALTYAQQQEQRASNLVTTGAGTVQNQQQTHSQLLQAQADYAKSQSAVTAARRQVENLQAQREIAAANTAEATAEAAQAKLNLQNTSIRAAQPGHIAQLSAAKGEYLVPGQNIAMFVPDPLWVTANFEETQIDDMRAGQPVTIQIDAYPGRTFKGHVDSIQHGSGTAFSLLPTENATGNYVKVVQRVPVKIDFDNLPQDVTLGPGMSVEPSVRVR